ncbi:uncharacterized protein LOC114541367, partial [Dendronephthya gigantea]|uniref:uncharacterized protein LOC114541367 n=1 Tax=Dendronephthya gigantea TaxID=151771 RepID=UPI001068E07D
MADGNIQLSTSFTTPDPEYKAILIQNKTKDATVLLDIYSKYDKLCWLPLKTEVIESQKQFFYRDKKTFSYKIRSKKETDQIYKTFPVKKCVDNKLIMLEEGDQDFKVNEHDLINYPREWQICVRRKNLEDETSEKMGRNLYAILKLDMKDVRKQSPEEQDKMIRKAYHKQMLIFHPDHNPNADNHICQEIIMAYSILGDREKRASYHDLTDYSGGWLSKSRWKAIFKPEAHGRHEGLKRVGLLLFSAVCVVGGVAITVLTGGLGLPILIVGNIIAGGLIGGSIQGAFRTISYDSIKNGVELKKYAKSFGIGAALGAIGGIATAGVTMAIIGTGNTAVAIAEAAVSDLIASGAASGSIN